MGAIPDQYHDLFEKPTIAHLGTLTPEGAPHVTPVWIDYDETTGHLLVNTERGRRKERNVDRDPAVGVSMTDPDDPYRRLSVVGEVVSVSTEGARAHIDELAGRYTGEAAYAEPIETERVLLHIAIEEVLE